MSLEEAIVSLFHDAYVFELYYYRQSDSSRDDCDFENGNHSFIVV